MISTEIKPRTRQEVWASEIVITGVPIEILCLCGQRLDPWVYRGANRTWPEAVACECEECGRGCRAELQFVPRVPWPVRGQVEFA